MKPLRDEYPRPQFRRDDWLMLNGEWEFEFDDNGDGEARGLDCGKTPLGAKINVPFAYQYKASGIGVYEKHETVWYRRTFVIDKAHAQKSALLCFNGSDYITDVWINGKHVLRHVGGYAPFNADITRYISAGENVITVRCCDPDDPAIPRGKQSWTGKPFTCWYVPSTGIWQSVWLEFFGADAVSEFTLTPELDDMSFFGEINTFNGIADEAELTVTFGGKTIKRQRISLDGKRTRYRVGLMETDFVDDRTLWTPDNPQLHYVDVKLFYGGKPVDEAHTRFGMRKVSVDANGNITLNNRKLYQRLILDQGYWRESGTTPPSADALKADIQAAKDMGFNGARKHQKLEDPYFYYYADEMGFLTWCEMPSAFHYCPDEVRAVSEEWQGIVSAVRLFSSVVCYVPLNESWGVRRILTDKKQQSFAAALYYLTKAIDPSRLISSNDGWENVQATDIIAIHDYAFDSREFADKYGDGADYDAIYPQGIKLMAYGNSAAGKPVLFTEFGGIAMQSKTDGANWGYNMGASDLEELYSRLQNLMDGVSASPFQGYCYTQLTDVQQEVNGLLDADHKPKADAARLKKIFANR